MLSHTDLKISLASVFMTIAIIIIIIPSYCAIVKDFILVLLGTNHIAQGLKQKFYDMTMVITPITSINSSKPTGATTMNMNSSSMSSMLQRGNIAMGFNQSKIMHHFIATPTGGEIMIVTLNSNDNNTIKQIRNHVVDIQKDFSEGNFTKPFFIHGQQVPGTKLMAERKDLIRYDTRQINNGSILLLTTNDKQLISATHQFIAFQSTQHSGH